MIQIDQWHRYNKIKNVVVVNVIIVVIIRTHFILPSRACREAATATTKTGI